MKPLYTRARASRVARVATVAVGPKRDSICVREWVRNSRNARVAQVASNAELHSLTHEYEGYRRGDTAGCRGARVQIAFRKHLSSMN